MVWARRIRSVHFVAVIAILAVGPPQSGAAIQYGGPARPLTEGTRLEGDLSGDHPARFAIALTGGQAATIVVTHRNIDLVIRTIGAGPSSDLEARSDGPSGEVRLAVVAEGSTRLTFEVASRYPRAAGGAYTLRVENVRSATGTDRQVANVQRHRREAVRLRDADRYSDALSTAREALALSEKTFDRSAPDIVRSLLLLAQLEHASANYGVADALYLRARAMPTAGNELLEAKVLDNHAATLIAVARFQEAESLAQASLAIRERIAGPSHFLVAASLATLADLHHERAHVQEAAATAQRAMEIAAQWYRPSDLVLGDFVNRVARAHLASGNYAGAEQLYGESLQARAEIAGAESLAVAESVGGLARVALLSNDNIGAEERHLRSLAIRERVLGPHHPQVANDVFNLGLISYRRRDFTGALVRYQRALAIREKTFGRVHPAIAVTLNNIGLVHWRQRDYTRAEEFFGRALQLLEQLYGPDSLRVTNPLGNLGIIAKETGQYPLAEARYRRALSIKEQHLGPDHPDLITLVESLAILYRDRGEYRQAEQMFTRTVRLTAASLGPAHPFVARHQANLAQLFWAIGDWDKAFAARARVIAIEERNLPLELAIGSERQKLAYFEPFLSDLEETITFHVRHPRDTPAARDLAVTTLLQRKGRIFDALADTISGFRNRATAEDRVLLDQLSHVTSDLAAAVLSESTRAPVAERQRRVATLADQRDRLEAEIQRRSAGYLTRSRPLTLDEVQNAVPVDAVLIEFSRYRPFDPAAPVEADNQFGAAHYIAYVVRHSGATQWKDLGSAAPIDTAVDRLRSALADPARRDVTRHSSALHRLVIAPLQPLIGNKTHLLVSPDGALNLIPFEALRGVNGRYLVEDHLVSYLTTGRDLLRMGTPRPVSGQIVVFADPEFGPPAPRQSTAAAALVQAASRPQPANTGPQDAGVYFARLTGTAKEARQILGVFPGATLRTGIAATEQALKSLHAPRILHIATHGFFLEEDGGAKAAAGPGATRAPAMTVRTENPLLRAGLALAGANLSRRSGDDGVLTALEAANLDLWGTKLVTLSACDTGVGVVRNGEGVYGLRRAFFLAGAESLVTSLWPVSDAVTREMMAGYYAGLEKGLGRGAALRRMQMQMLTRPGRAHPFYWASFIHAGEWANLDGRR